MKKFSQEQLEAIAKAFGNIEDGLTESEIGRLFRVCKIENVNPGRTKEDRLYETFAAHVNKTKDYSTISRFIKEAMSPNRHLDNRLRYETMRQNLNEAISFAGVAVDETGEIIPIKAARTLSDAEEGARALRISSEFRGIHPEVLKFCRAELLENNYFHAVLEATKSIADKLRDRTGLTYDGSKLADHALGIISGRPPMIKINAFQTESDKSVQQGFLYLVRVYSACFATILPTLHAYNRRRTRMTWKTCCCLPR